MNRYRFINQSSFQPSADAIKNAKAVTKIDEILALSKSVGEYEFTESKELTERFRKAISGSLTLEMLPNGNKVNRMKIVADNGSYRLRVYGNGRGNEMPEREFTADELKALSFGFCKSDNELVTEKRTDSLGNVYEVPVMYVNLA